MMMVVCLSSGCLSFLRYRKRAACADKHVIHRATVCSHPHLFAFDSDLSLLLLAMQQRPPDSQAGTAQSAFSSSDRMTPTS